MNRGAGGFWIEPGEHGQVANDWPPLAIPRFGGRSEFKQPGAPALAVSAMNLEDRKSACVTAKESEE